MFATHTDMHACMHACIGQANLIKLKSVISISKISQQ